MPQNFPEPARRRALRTLAALGAAVAAPRLSANPATGAPVRVGLTAELRMASSTSDDAISLGLSLAMQDINARGGVLNGRPLQLVTTDNRSVPARGVANVGQLAAMPDMAAFLCGKFSPVVLEQLPVIHAMELPLLNPWAAVDAIVDNGHPVNYAFRIGLSDSLAMTRLLDEAATEGKRKLGLMLPASAWGRSCRAAVERHLTAHPGLGMQTVAIEWHRWGEGKLIEGYQRLTAAGAQAVVLVANEPEGAELIKAIAALAEPERHPIYSHWGITGGRFPTLCGPALHEVSLKVVQSFSFEHPRNAAATSLAQRAMAHFEVADPLQVPSMTGIGPSYDLVHLLAQAIDAAGSVNRREIRSALERLPAHEGATRRYAPAFTPERHEALQLGDVLMCHFDPAGRLHQIKRTSA